MLGPAKPARYPLLQIIQRHQLAFGHAMDIAKLG